MNHDSKYRELLVLSFYGELTESERKCLDVHLRHCSECRKELASLSSLHHVLDGNREMISEDLIRQARQELFQKLRSVRIGEKRVKPGNHSKWVRRLFSVWRPAVVAAAMLLTGLGLGYFFFYQNLQSSPATGLHDLKPFTSSEVMISGVRFKELDSEKGKVALGFDAVRRIAIEGNIQDSRIQRLLAYALGNEQNPGVRLRALRAIGEGNGNASESEPIESALVTALKTEENPAVR